MAVQNKSTVPIGTVLEGKFRITREIGRGGMAAVYEAENVDIGKRVAVKVLAAELITSRVVRERFIREARAASAVRSPHICDVYDSGMFEERPFLVMELLEGESLYDMLTRVRRLDIPTTLTVITQTARGLGKAHEANIVHRDLKPENIFVSKDEDGGLIVKLLDFGLAKFYEPTNDGDAKTVRLTREGALFGTPAYMSPEQAKGQGEVDHRSDLWALGCIVYECLTGTTVWGVEQGVAMILAQVASAPVPRPSRLRPDLPLTFDGWFGKALDRDVARRYQTAREFADSLAGALNGEGAASSAQSLRQQSLHSDADAVHVDELLAPNLSDLPPPPPLPDAEVSADIDTPRPVSKEDRPAASGIASLLGAAAVVLGGYGAWLHWLHPAGERGTAASAVRTAAPQASARPKAAPKPAVDPETEPFAALVRDAQGLFAKDPKSAIDKLKAAYALGSAAPVRALLSHASIAVDEVTPRGCRVTAVARPRPYQLEQAASTPTLVRTSEGVLVGWVDNHADARRRQGHVVLLDEALRRKGEPLAVTPEASNAQDLSVVAAGDKVVLAFHDDGGKQQGVYVRQLGADGRITSAARRIAKGKATDGSLSLIAVPDGGFIATWAEEVTPGATDLFVQRLGASLAPEGDVQRLSAFPAAKGAAERVSSPDAAIAHGELTLAFSLLYPGSRAQVMLLSVPMVDLDKGKAVDARKKGASGAEPVLGTLRLVAKTLGRTPQPRLACEKDGCLVGWDEEKGGAYVAFLEHGKPQPLWHRQFAEKGARPAIVGDESGQAMAWFEESRLRFAAVGRDGVGMPSVVNRASGLQPHPAIARGSKPGEWLVAWRDFEAAHFELFALKAECP